jgi:phosphomannomutase
MRRLHTYKHLFFDLDDTLTLSKSRIENRLKELLAQSGKDVVVVSGQTSERITFQTDNLRTFKLGQNGNHAEDDRGALLWNVVLTRDEKRDILMHIARMQEYTDWHIKNVHDLIDDRGSQMSYSLVGHNEDVPYKKSFDPHSRKREELLSKVPFTSRDVEVKIGGTTTFDYFKRGYHKGFNVAKFIAHMGWDKHDAVYFGDKLTPGGNDETVIGVIDTVAVISHEDTYQKLHDALTQKN